MIHQRISPAAPRLLGRAGLLLAMLVCIVLSGGPAVRADDGGLLQDPVPTIVETATQAVEPVVETVEPVVQPPEVQPVSPTVQEALEPTVTAAEQAVEPAAGPAEQAAGPGEAVVEAALPHTSEPAGQAEEPAVESAPAPVESQIPTVDGPEGGHPAEVSKHDGPRHVDAGAAVRADRHGHATTADRAYLTDLAPRVTGRTWILDDHGSGDDQGQEQNASLWALTNALMHHIAGDPLPGWINAGLRPGAVGPRTPWAAPLLLGLLGFLCLVVARRRLR